jgi:hypothetical protein
MTGQAQHVEHKQKAAVEHQAAELVQEVPAVAAELVDLLALQRAMLRPDLSTPGNILALQRVAGNRTVSRLIQAKLTVGPASDCYEQEADRVAEQVLSSHDSPGSEAEREPSTVAGANRGPSVQRQEDEEEIQTQPLAATITPLLQRQGEEEEVQTKSEIVRAEPGRVGIKRQSDIRKPFDAGPGIENRLAVNRGSGSPLPSELRAYMEPRFGADFSGVRVHTGSEAASLNKDLSAQAFTHGQDIYLGTGRYEPGTDAGKRLLAHELTHTIQQTGMRAKRAQTSRSDPGVVQRWSGTPVANEEGMILANAHLHAEPEKGRHLGIRTFSGPAYVGPRLRPGDAFVIEAFDTQTPDWIDVTMRSGAAVGRRGFLAKAKGEKSTSLSLAQKGKLLKQAYQKETGAVRGAKAHGTEAITRSEQQLLLTTKQRAEQLKGLLAPAGPALSLRLFDMVHNLLTGPAVKANYETGGANLHNDLNAKFRGWGHPTDWNVTVKYLEELGAKDEPTLAMRLAFYLGLVSTPRATDEFVIDVLEELVQDKGWKGVTDGLGEMTSTSTTLKTEAAWFKHVGHYTTKRINALKNQDRVLQEYKTKAEPAAGHLTTEVTAATAAMTVAEVKAALAARETTAPTPEAKAEFEEAVRIVSAFEQERPDLTPAKINTAAGDFVRDHQAQVRAAVQKVSDEASRTGTPSPTITDVKRAVATYASGKPTEEGTQIVAGKVASSRAREVATLKSEIEGFRDTYMGGLNTARRALDAFAGVTGCTWQQVKTFAETGFGLRSEAAAKLKAVVLDYIGKSPAASELATHTWAEDAKKRKQNEFIVASVEYLRAMFKSDTGAMSTTVEDLIDDVKTWLKSVEDSKCPPPLTQVQLRADAVGETVGGKDPLVYKPPKKSPAIEYLKSAANRKIGLHTSNVHDLIALLKDTSGDKKKEIERTETKVLKEQSWRTRSADDLMDMFDEMDDEALAEYLKGLDAAKWTALKNTPVTDMPARHAALKQIFDALDAKLKAENRWYSTAAIKQEMRSKITARLLFGEEVSEGYQDFKALVENNRSIRDILETAIRLDARAIAQIKADLPLLTALEAKLTRSTTKWYKVMTTKAATNRDRALTILKLLGIGLDAPDLQSAMTALTSAKTNAGQQLVYPTLAATSDASAKIKLGAPGITATTPAGIMKEKYEKEFEDTELKPSYYAALIDMEFGTLAGKGLTSIRWHRIASAIHRAQRAARYLVDSGKTPDPSYAGTMKEKMEWFTTRVLQGVKKEPTAGGVAGGNARKWANLKKYLEQPVENPMTITAWLGSLRVERAGTAMGKREALIEGMLEDLSGEELLFEWSNIDDFYRLTDEYTKAKRENDQVGHPNYHKLAEFLETTEHVLLNFPISISRKRLEWLKREFGTWSRADRAKLVVKIYDRVIEAARGDDRFQAALNFARSAGAPGIGFAKLADIDFEIMAERTAFAKALADTSAERGIQFTSKALTFMQSGKHEVRQAAKTRLTGLHRGVTKEATEHHGKLDTTADEKMKKLEELKGAQEEFVKADVQFKAMRSRAAQAAVVTIAILAALVAAAATQGAALPVVAAAFVGAGIAVLASLATTLVKWKLSPADVNLRDTAWQTGVDILVAAISAGITSGVAQLPVVGSENIVEFLQNGKFGDFFKTDVGETLAETFADTLSGAISSIGGGITSSAAGFVQQELMHGKLSQEATIAAAVRKELMALGTAVTLDQVQRWLLSLPPALTTQSDVGGALGGAVTVGLTMELANRWREQQAQEQEAKTASEEELEAEQKKVTGRFVPESLKIKSFERPAKARGPAPLMPPTPLPQGTGLGSAAFVSDLQEGWLSGYPNPKEAFEGWQRRMNAIKAGTALRPEDYVGWVTENEFKAFKRLSTLPVTSMAEFDKKVTQVLRAQGNEGLIDDVVDDEIWTALAITAGSALETGIEAWKRQLYRVSSRKPSDTALVTDALLKALGGTDLTKGRFEAFRLVDYRMFASLTKAKADLAIVASAMKANVKFADDVRDEGIRKGLGHNPTASAAPIIDAIERWKTVLENLNSNDPAQVAKVTAELLTAVGGMTKEQLKAFRLVDDTQFPSLKDAQSALSLALTSMLTSPKFAEDVQVDDFRTALGLLPATKFAEAIKKWRERLEELNDPTRVAQVPDALREKVGGLTKEQLEAFRLVDHRAFASLSEAKTDLSIAASAMNAPANLKFVDDVKDEETRKGLGCNPAAGPTPIANAIESWTRALASLNSSDPAKVGQVPAALLPALAATAANALTMPQLKTFRLVDNQRFDSLVAAKPVLERVQTKLKAKAQFASDMQNEAIRTALSITPATGLDPALTTWTAKLTEVNRGSITQNLPPGLGGLSPAQYADFRLSNHDVFPNLVEAKRAFEAFKATQAPAPRRRRFPWSRP